MKKMMNFLFLSCKRASELIEKRAEGNLSPIEEMQLSVHLSMCKACSSWKTQSEKLDLLLKNKLKQKEVDYSTGFTSDNKRKVIEQIKNL